VLTIAAFKYTKWGGYLFGLITIFLTIATVYCHYHWFIDAVAGIFTGILGYQGASWVHKKLLRETA
jgi:membrane-associated phospholipid phosphatase